MATLETTLALPSHYQVAAELMEQFSSRPGHQRCVAGCDELLLVVHEVPKPGVPEREALFFWRNRDEEWFQPGGTGLSELFSLLERFEKVIDANESLIDDADTAAEVFGILRQSGPLTRTTRNLVLALDQALSADADDREIRTCLDRAREIDRAADLLHGDARVTLEFWRAERAEEHSRASARLGRIAYRMNLLAGFFLPLMALGTLFGMNVAIPGFVESGFFFWGILLLGMMFGAGLLYLVGRKTGRGADFESELDDE